MLLTSAQTRVLLRGNGRDPQVVLVEEKLGDALQICCQHISDVAHTKVSTWRVGQDQDLLDENCVRYLVCWSSRERNRPFGKSWLTVQLGHFCPFGYWWSWSWRKPASGRMWQGSWRRSRRSLSRLVLPSEQCKQWSNYKHSQNEKQYPRKNVTSNNRRKNDGSMA